MLIHNWQGGCIARWSPADLFHLGQQVLIRIQKSYCSPKEENTHTHTHTHTPGETHSENITSYIRWSESSQNEVHKHRLSHVFLLYRQSCCFHYVSSRRRLLKSSAAGDTSGCHSDDGVWCKLDSVAENTETGVDPAVKTLGHRQGQRTAQHACDEGDGDVRRGLMQANNQAAH